MKASTNSGPVKVKMLRITRLVAVKCRRRRYQECRRFVSNFSKSNVAIIGGGMSGLSALKELKQVGFDCTLFERDNDIGGVCTFILMNMHF